MAVRFHPHAVQRMAERGASQEEVTATVKHGEEFPAQYGRTGFRRNYSFDSQWRSRYFRTKQVEAYCVLENNDWLVISVITRYF